MTDSFSANFIKSIGRVCSACSTRRGEFSTGLRIILNIIIDPQTQGPQRKTNKEKREQIQTMETQRKQV